MEIKSTLIDSDSMSRIIKRLAHEMLEKNKGTENIALIGVRTRGVPIAMRLKKCISTIENAEVPMGILDITFYRDDLPMRSYIPEVKSSEINFSVTGKDVILVDDVLYTGRTVRAAIDALMAIGRPKSIQLLVLVDRGHRELPIRADNVGKNVPTSRDEAVSVKLAEIDGTDSIDLCSK
jgi:pyrimidine operon attenuation protein/uracil phosphoribosyltransferase